MEATSTAPRARTTWSPADTTRPPALEWPATRPPPSSWCDARLRFRRSLAVYSFNLDAPPAFVSQDSRSDTKKPCLISCQGADANRSVTSLALLSPAPFKLLNLRCSKERKQPGSPSTSTPASLVCACSPKFRRTPKINKQRPGWIRVQAAPVNVMPQSTVATSS